MNKELIDDETMARIQAEIAAFVFQRIDDPSLSVLPIEMLKDLFGKYDNEDLVMAAFHLGGGLAAMYYRRKMEKELKRRSERMVQDEKETIS